MSKNSVVVPEAREDRAVSDRVYHQHRGRQGNRGMPVLCERLVAVLRADVPENRRC